MSALSATRAQVIAYRLDAQHLAARLPVSALTEAAGACGIQDSPPGSAALALHARLDGLTPDALHQALWIEKSLLQTMSLRGAPYLFPTTDAAIFTRGALPESEEDLRFFIQGAAPGLEQVGMNAAELVEWTAVALREVLDGQQMRKDPLGRALGEHIARDLPPDQTARWQQPSPYAAEQFLGESLARFALYVLGLRGLFCYAPRIGEAAEFLLTEQWLGHPLPEVDPVQVQAGLARRYLRCYGPSSPEEFAHWAGISPDQAVRSWARIEPELLPVGFEGRRAYLHAQDLERFQHPQPAGGIRLLPPHDPYLLLRDRATLIPERALQRVIWRTVGNTGALLVDGQFSGIWRAKKRGKRLDLAVQSFTSPTTSIQTAIEVEAASLLAFKDCTSLTVTYPEPDSSQP